MSPSAILLQTSFLSLEAFWYPQAMSNNLIKTWSGSLVVCEMCLEDLLSECHPQLSYFKHPFCRWRLFKAMSYNLISPGVCEMCLKDLLSACRPWWSCLVRILQTSFLFLETFHIPRQWSDVTDHERLSGRLRLPFVSTFSAGTCPMDCRLFDVRTVFFLWCVSTSPLRGVWCILLLRIFHLSCVLKRVCWWSQGSFLASEQRLFLLLANQVWILSVVN